ncbi:MAG: response regulator [Ardenticatenaceae bacterium]|nr:response regulator [Ardenticatenaceae bacterium]
MEWQYTPYTLLLFITGGITLATGAYIASKRHVPGANHLLVLLLSTTAWIFAYLLELSAVDLKDKLFWAKVEYVGIVSAPVHYALFILNYIGIYQRIKRPRRLIIGLTIIPLTTLLLAWSNESHRLIWSVTDTIVDQGLTYLMLVHGFWYWIYIVFVYALLAITSFLLIRKIVTTPDQFRGQIVLIILSCLSPWLSSLLYITGTNPFPNLDPTPFSFAISSLCFVWALFHFKLLDIVPIARGLVIEKLETGVIVIDGLNRVMDINATAVSLLQQEKRHILGQPLILEHSAWGSLATALQESMPAKLEMSLNQVYYEVAVTVLDDKKPQANGRVITLHNVTKHKEAELQLQKAKNAAEAADQAKTNFLTNISHEIRTPLNAVVGMAEMLRQTQLNANQAEMIDVVMQSSDSLLGLINSILDYAQLEAGNLTLQKQAFDLTDCIESAIEQVSQLANDKLIKLVYKIDENTPTWLVGDAVRLRQILTNLLENGIKFTEEGAVELFVTQTSDAMTSPQLHFSVQDSGIGIAADQIPHLFSPFHQVDSSMTRSYGGNGLGLAICKHLVGLMAGEIFLQSTVGQGTAVNFTAQFGTPTNKNVPVITLRKQKTTLASKRLMVITKDASQRRHLSREARMVGLEVYAAASAQEASYWITHSQSFDIALLDTAVWQEDPNILTTLHQIDAPQPIPTILLVPPNTTGTAVANGSSNLFSGFLPYFVTSSQMQDTLLNVLATSNTTSAVPPEPGKMMSDRFPLKILIVEDNKLNQRILENMLAKLGYSADVASNGQLAVQAAYQQAYDVILMDIQMPVMDGVEATQNILKENQWQKRPYIIAVTAHALEGDREHYLASGMNEYISKPITMNQLVEVLYQSVSVHSESISSTPEPTPKPPEETADTPVEPAKNDPPLENPLDLALLVQLVGDNTDGFLTTMTPIFLEDTQEILQRLALAVQQADSVAIRHAAHTIKGTSASMALTKLSQLSREMEMAAKEENLANAPHLLEQIQAEFKRAEAALTQMGHTTV